MLFQKWGCLVGPENRIFRKLISVDRKKMALTTEIILHFHFHFKVFLERERERESERASALEEEDRAPVQFDDRRRTPSSSPRRSRELQYDDRDPRSRSTLREIAVVELELAKHRAIEPSRASIVDDFFSRLWLVFFWVCLFLLLFQIPENIFRKIF